MSGWQGQRPEQGQSPYEQGYPQQPYPSQQGYPPQAGQPYQQGYRSSGGQPQRSPLLIIGIVVAAVVALVAIGGIIIGLSSGRDGVPATTITPAPQAPPSDEASPDPDPAPSSGPSGAPSGGPTPGSNGAKSLDLGHDVTLVPAPGWVVRKQTADLAQLSGGKDVFVGQTAALDAETNPGQICTAWHKQLAEGEGGGKFAAPETVDVGTDTLRAATCSAEITASSGQGSSALQLVTVVSVRSSDGVTVLGTAAFPEGSDADQLQKDFASMTNSMLQTQADG